jgi:hypothetical protein
LSEKDKSKQKYKIPKRIVILGDLKFSNNKYLYKPTKYPAGIGRPLNILEGGYLQVFIDCWYYDDKVLAGESIIVDQKCSKEVTLDEYTTT